MTRIEKRMLREQEHRFKFIKINKKLVSVGLTTLIGIGIIGLSEGVEASASEWKATTVEEMKQKVRVEDGKYTFESGDTFYAIGEAINIRYEKLMEWNGYTQGTEYSIPVGKVITWNGDHITITDPQGNVIKDTTVQPSDKINPEKPVGSNSTNQTVSTSNNGNNSANKGTTVSSDLDTQNTGGNKENSNSGGSNTNNGGNTSNNNGSNGTPSNPSKPTEPNKPEPNPDPIKPIDPPKPEKPSQTELEKLRAELADLQAKLVVAKQTLTQAQQELADAQGQGNKAEIEAKIVEQQTALATANSVITSKQAELAGLANSISSAQAELATALVNAQGVNAQIESAQAKVTSAQGVLSLAQSELSSAQTALEANPEDEGVKAQVSSAQAKVSQAEGQVAVANSELANAQSNASSLNQAVTNAQNAVSSLEGQKQSAQTELSTAEAAKQQAESQIASLNEQLANIGNTDLSELEAKVAEASKVVTDLEAKIAEVEAKIAELEGNIPEPVQVDKTALTNLYNSTTSLDSTKYTTESWNNLKSALSSAKAVVDNTKATQAEVDSAQKVLQGAINSLVEKPSEPEIDKTALGTAIANAKGMDMSKYTDETVQILNQALGTAQTVFGNAQATQSEVDSAQNVLQSAIDGLKEKPVEEKVDKTALETLVSKVKGTDTTKFTDETSSAFTQALTNAQSILGNKDATQAQVDNAVSALQQTFDNLAEKPTEPEKVDKTALQSAVDSISSLKQSDYTSASWSKLQTALTNAKAVLDNKDATQSQVDSATSALNNAKSALVKKADKTALDQAIGKAPASQGSYTDASWKALQSALSTAKQLSGKEDATQSEVDSATSALNKAISDLKVQKYTITVIHKDNEGKILDKETFEVEKGKNIQVKSKGFDGYELVGEGSKTLTNVSENGTVTFNYKKQQSEEEQMKEVQDTVNKGAIDIWNDYRSENGKTQAYENDILQKMADQRAKELVEIYDANHTRPNGFDVFGYNEKTGEWGDSLAEEFGYYNVEGMGVKRDIVGENIAKIEGVSLEWIEENGANYVMNAWKNSTGHNNTLLASSANNPINQFAIGSYITKNNDGTYNVFYVALVGYDKNLK